MSTTQPTTSDDSGAEAPSDEEVAEAIGVDVRELRAFVDAFGEEEPTPAAVLGWATCSPGAISTVEAWLNNGGKNQ